MTYKILTNRRVGSYYEGAVVEMDAITEFWEHQLLAGNAVVIEQPTVPAVATEAPREEEEAPRPKGKGKRGKSVVVEGDPED